MSVIREKINCPSCQAILDLSRFAAGAVITCGICQQRLMISGDSPDQLQEPPKDNVDDLLEYYTAQTGDDLLYKANIGQSNRSMSYYCWVFLMLGVLFLCLYFAFHLSSGVSSPFRRSADAASEITAADVAVTAVGESDLKMAEAFYRKT